MPIHWLSLMPLIAWCVHLGCALKGARYPWRSLVVTLLIAVAVLALLLNLRYASGMPPVGTPQDDLGDHLRMLNSSIVTVFLGLIMLPPAEVLVVILWTSVDRKVNLDD
jgi:hypothetical protein